MAPRLKPLKEEKDISAVPLSEPVLVEIALPPTGQEPEPQGDGEQPQKTVREPEQQDDGGAAKLQRDLETMKAADKLRQEEVTRERKRADDAIKQVQERDRQLADERSHREQAVTDNITSALSGAQAEQAAALQERRAARLAQDQDAEDVADVKLARASNKILNYEAAAAELDDRRKQSDAQAEMRRQQPQQQAQPVDVVTAINNNPGIVQTEKDWLLKHQEVLVDRQRGVELEAAYIKSQRKGLHRGTDAYFKFLDQELGYTEQAPKTEERTDDEEESTIMAAPVSRDNVSPSNGQAQSSNRVVLTPEQREFAKSMGISEISYAQNVLKLRSEKKSNPDKYRG